MIGVTFVSKVSSASRGAAIADDDADDDDDDWDEYVDEGGSSDEDDSSESLKKHRQNKLQQWADVVVRFGFFQGISLLFTWRLTYRMFNVQNLEKNDNDHP